MKRNEMLASINRVLAEIAPTYKLFERTLQNFDEDTHEEWESKYIEIWSEGSEEAYFQVSYDHLGECSEIQIYANGKNLVSVAVAERIRSLFLSEQSRCMIYSGGKWY